MGCLLSPSFWWGRQTLLIRYYRVSPGDVKKPPTVISLSSMTPLVTLFIKLIISIELIVFIKRNLVRNLFRHY